MVLRYFKKLTNVRIWKKQICQKSEKHKHVNTSYVTIQDQNLLTCWVSGHKSKLHVEGRQKCGLSFSKADNINICLLHQIQKLRMEAEKCWRVYKHNDTQSHNINIVPCSSHTWLNKKAVIFVCLNVPFLTLLHWFHLKLVLEIYSSQFNDGPHRAALTYTSNQAGIQPHKTS